MAELVGSQSLNDKERSHSVILRWLRAILMSSGPGLENRTPATAFPLATAFTSLLTAERLGSTWVCEIRNGSPQSSFIHRTLTSYMSERSDMRLLPTKSAACS